MAQSRERPPQAQAETDLYFGSFRLERVKRLWCGEHEVDMRPRPLAVLRYLAERPGQLISSEEFLKQLWPGIYVTRTVVRVCVREIRRALEEDPTAPRIIETVGKLGYRFIGTVQSVASTVQSQEEEREQQTAPSPSFPVATLKSPASFFVGRGQELARLHELFARAQRGERQTLFVFGEPGIGKTALVDCFLDQVRTNGSVRIGRGQCIEHYGPGEAYLPILEALGQLCHELGGEQVMAVLRRHAPSWLALLSGVLAADEREALRRDLQGRSQEHMLLELAGALEAVATDAVLVLVVEDLQWSDVSTLDALAYLARQRQPAQLYMLGTYRPVEVVVHEHPLRPVVQDLYGQQLCEELVLDLFTEAEVEEYLRQRFGRSAALTELSQMIYRRTEGNALFMVNFVDYLLGQGLIAEAGSQLEVRADFPMLSEHVPNSLQQMLLRQIESLPADEQQLLGVASVSGMTFTAAEIAGVVDRTLEEVEEVYDHLTRREQLIAEDGIAEWPDGTVTVQYEFRHTLCQQVVYEQLGQGRRARLHRQIGEWKEGRYGDQAVENTGELILHFTEGRDYRRAGQYRRQAAETAQRRGAYREAIEHCQKGLELLEHLPDTPERERQELALRMTLGVALIATKGYTAPEVEQTYLRARTLCEREGKTSHLFSVLHGLWNCYTTRGELQTAYTLAEQLLDIAQRVDDSTLRLMAHWAMGRAQYWYGGLLSAREHLEQILTLYNPTEHGALVTRYSQDVQLTAPSFVAVALWLLGYPDQARRRIEQALAQESDLPSSFSLAYALTNAALVHQFCGEILRTQERAEATITFATKHGFPHWVNWGTALRGWALAAQGQEKVGISLLRQSLAALATSGVRLARSYILILLGDVCQRMGQIEDGLNTVAEAITQVQETGERYCEAELYRLKGELTLQQFEVSGSKFHSKQSPRSKVQSLQKPNPKSSIPNPKTRQRRVSIRLLRLPASSKRSRWNCAPP